MKSKLTTCISNDFKEGLKAGKQKERQRIREEIEKIFNKITPKKTYNWDTEKDVERGVNLANEKIMEIRNLKKQVLALLSEEKGK